MIKEYFTHYFLHQSDVIINLQTNKVEVLNNLSEPWEITLLDTGLHTMTGGRIKRAKKHIDDTFMLTYGDGVGNIDINNLVKFHKSHGKLATMTVVQPPGRFGAVDIDGDEIVGFREKPKGDGAWINGGFFVLEPQVIDYIEGDDTYWEKEPLENLAKDGQLMAYKHVRFWKAMDTLRDKRELENLWKNNNAYWKVWD
jgi:glucose-1-phosphate cytidylyltransferase